MIPVGGDSPHETADASALGQDRREGRSTFPLVAADRLVRLDVIGGNRSSTESVVRVAAGQTLDVKPLSFILRDKSVSGSSVDPDGKPLEGASVTAGFVPSQKRHRGNTGQRTGKDGRSRSEDCRPPIGSQGLRRAAAGREGPQHAIQSVVNAEPGPDRRADLLDPDEAQGKTRGGNAADRETEEAVGAPSEGRRAEAKPAAASEPPPAMLTAAGKVVDPAGKPVAGADGLSAGVVHVSDQPGRL